MMRPKPMKETSPAPAAEEAEDKWEVRPGGMLVQKRDPASEYGSAVRVPAIRVKVKHNGVSHEIYIGSQATFGELKKAVSAKTGQHPDDLKVMFKEKERDSKAFLDTAGVKDRSKVTLLDDPEGRARRLIELRRADSANKAAKSVTRIGIEVDRLAKKVAALEMIVNKGGKVVEGDMIQLTELLMNELLKLDAIVAEGDVKAQRKIQVKRVQKYVETLDLIKVKNSTLKVNGQINQQPSNPNPNLNPNPQPKPQAQYTEPQQYKQQQRTPFQKSSPVVSKTNTPFEKSSPVVTTNWETFDLLSSVPSTSSATSASTIASTASIPTPRYDWELF